MGELAQASQSTCRRRFEVQSKDAVFNDAQSGLREGLLSAMRQIRFPSIASRTLPIKKPRPETAFAAGVTRHIFEMRGEHRVHRVQFAAHRRVCNRTLHVEQMRHAHERWRFLHLRARTRMDDIGAALFSDEGKRNIDKLVRRATVYVADQYSRCLRAASEFLMRMYQTLRDQR